MARRLEGEPEVSEGKLSRKIESENPQYGFRGKLGVTTSSWLFTDEGRGLKGAFAVTNALNNTRPQEDWVGIEVYPTDPRVITFLRHVPGIRDFIPPHVTPDMVARLQEEYPRTRVDQVHLPFSASRYETYIHRPTIGENFLPVKEGIEQRIYQGVWMLLFEPTLSGKSITLAEELGVGANAHVNVIEALAERDELDSVKKRLSFLQAENERPYRSPHGKRLRDWGISSQELMSNPKVIADHVVDHYGLDGLLFGADHAVQVGFDPAEKLPEIAHVLSRVHIAGGGGASGHELIEPGDPLFTNFFEAASRTRFNQPVSVAFDGNPKEMGKLSFEDQVSRLDGLFKWIRETQEGK